MDPVFALLSQFFELEPLLEGDDSLDSVQKVVHMLFDDLTLAVDLRQKVLVWLMTRNLDASYSIHLNMDIRNQVKGSLAH